jgi:hypothetical protein
MTKLTDAQKKYRDKLWRELQPKRNGAYRFSTFDNTYIDFFVKINNEDFRDEHLSNNDIDGIIPNCRDDY